MKRSSGVIIVDAENVSKELFQYAFSYIKHRKFCTSSDLYIFGNKQNIPLKYYNKYTHATFINTYVGKNLADTYMCCFISKLLYENDDITTFFLITQDRDMSCIIKLISDYGKCAVSITVPQELDTIDIAAAVGDIDLNGLTSSNLILKADVGDIDISDCDFGQVELDAAVGDIDFSNSSFLTMNAVNDVGDVKVDTDDLSDYQIELNTSIGEVSVNGRGSHRSFEQDGDTNRKLVIDNSTGDIELTYR